MLEGIHTFKPANLLVGQTGVPAIIEQDNGDGTYQGRYDLNKMSSTQKLSVLADDALDTIINKLHIVPTKA